MSTETLPSANKIFEALRNSLFADRDLNTFAVLDGASIPDLLERLEQESLNQFCLYRGELDQELAAAAPYLIQLEEFSPFTDWVLQQGWGNHWGIFATSPSGIISMRHHFRKLLMVKDTEGKAMYFRYYDPRVLNIFLPTTTVEQREEFFGEIITYLAEGKERDCFFYKRKDQELIRKGLSPALLECLA